MIFRAGMKLDKYLTISCAVIIICLLILGIIAGVKSLFEPEQKETINSFIGSYADVDIEEFWGNGVRHIRVRNNGEDEAYVRCAPIFTVRDSEGNVREAILHDDEVMNINYDDWVRIGSYYYCRMPVSGGKYTPFLIEGCKSQTDEGYTIELKILVSAIDSSDPATVTAHWGIEVNSDGTIGEV